MLLVSHAVGVFIDDMVAHGARWLLVIVHLFAVVRAMTPRPTKPTTRKKNTTVPCKKQTKTRKLLGHYTIIEV